MQYDLTQHEDTIHHVRKIEMPPTVLHNVVPFRLFPSLSRPKFGVAIFPAEPVPHLCLLKLTDHNPSGSVQTHRTQASQITVSVSNSKIMPWVSMLMY
jgi:hypothetical protein